MEPSLVILWYLVVVLFFRPRGKGRLNGFAVVQPTYFSLSLSLTTASLPASPHEPTVLKGRRTLRGLTVWAFRAAAGEPC